MTKKQRHLAIEGVCLLLIGIFAGGIAIPALVSAKDSLVAVVGILLAGALCAWMIAFFYRVTRL